MKHDKSSTTTTPVDLSTHTPAPVTRPSSRRSGTLTTAMLTLVTLLGALLLTAPSAEGATACTATSSNGQLYCPATIWGVTSTSYGVGTRVVLRAVSVTARSTSTVTVQAWEFPPCPPGYFCGSSMTLDTLTVPWKGQGRPTVGKSIDLYGTTTLTSLTPAGYKDVAPTDCYYC